MKKIKNHELNLKNIGESVTLFGWVNIYRNLGKKVFIDLRDKWGITQVVVPRSLIGSIRKEYVLKVIGNVVKRQSPNSKLLTGEIEVLATEVEVLATAPDQLPIDITKDVYIKESIRMKYRYLDLRRKKMQSNLLTRHKLNKAFRDFLSSKEFIEVETPMLSKPTPEGASDFLVQYKDDDFFALPQSPQIYKQLLMASGVERYYQIARVFRNEALRSDRQLEFTQLDIELSFTTEESVILLVEQMMKYVMGVFDVDLPTTSFERMDYNVAIDEYGVDRPDIRFGNKLIELTDKFKDSTFRIFKNAKTIKGIFIDKEISKKELKVLEEFAKQNKAKGIMWASLVGGKQVGPGWKFLEKELTPIFNKYSSNAVNKTLLMVADSYEVVCHSLGSVRVALNNMYQLTNPNDFKFVWVVNFPLFEKNDDDSISAMHHPFTSPLKNELNDFDKNENILTAGSRSYDLVLNGSEIGGGSIRIHNLDIQKRMFKVLGLSNDEMQDKFGFFFEAFDKGMPPHGGIAFGIDRIAMILTKENSIREVIAFPKNLSGSGLMEDIPIKIIGNKNG